MKYELSNKDAVAPTYGSAKAAGADLYSPKEVWIWPKSKVVINTGVKLEIPEGFYMKVEARSGTSVRASLETGAGVIDEDYRKEVGVVLYNFGWWPYKVKKGDRIAQGIFQKYCRMHFAEGLVDENDRGGYGSTGR